MKQLDHTWIEDHIPHKGSMCLLDSVQRWNASEIECIAVSHRDAANPLRNDDGLGIAAGVEYAAQAMAVHGALLAAEQEVPRSGFLTSVRNVEWSCSRIDDVASDLLIKVVREAFSLDNVLYRFCVSAGAATLLSGRATVMLSADAVGETKP